MTSASAASSAARLGSPVSASCSARYSRSPIEAMGCPWNRQALVELQLGELRPAGVGLRIVLVRGLLVEVRPADPAQAGAVGPAGQLRRELERERIARPGREVELVVRADVGRDELLRRAGLMDLAHVDGE